MREKDPTADQTTQRIEPAPCEATETPDQNGNEERGPPERGEVRGPWDNTRLTDIRVVGAPEGAERASKGSCAYVSPGNPPSPRPLPPGLAPAGQQHAWWPAHAVPNVIEGGTLDHPDRR